MLLHPVEGLARGDLGRAGADREMGPRTDGDGHVDAPFVQPSVLLEGLGQEDVLPAADEQDRDLGPIQGDAQVHRHPVGVAQVRTAEPVRIPAGTSLEVGPRRLDQRQLVHGLGVGVLGGGGAIRAAHHPALLLVDDHVAPTQEVEAEGAGPPDVLAEVVRGDGDHGRGQVRRRVGQQGPLGERQVRAPDGGEGARVPGLVAHPGHHVVAVVDLADHGQELPARPEGATAGHEQRVVSRGRRRSGPWATP